MFERHQRVAIAIYLLIYIIKSVETGLADALDSTAALLALLVPIFFYRTFAYLSSFGFLEHLASDFKAETRAGPYAVLFWILYLIACGFVLFE